MRETADIKSVGRIIDANINRLKEGLRVLEETARFILNSKPLTYECKKIRHAIDAAIRRIAQKKSLLKERDSINDVGRRLHLKTELTRKGWQDIFSANIARVKESTRVLEEFSKLLDTGAALQFKRTRYRIYEFEKKFAQKLFTLRAHR